MQDKKGGDDWTSPSFSQVKLIALFHVVLPGKPLGASSQRHTKGGDFVCLVSSLSSGFMAGRTCVPTQSAP